ncbi:hypothetical protein GGF42_005589, partial [Coemansia sp. RSA 2424]
MRTPETHILNTLGLDAVIFLRFYKMCMRLLLDIAFFSIAIIWPINIVWSKTNLNPQTSSKPSGGGGTGSNGGDLGITLTYSVTDYLFNLTLDTNDPKQKWNLVPHIFFVYVFSGLAYYHISKFSSRWASLRWHFLMQSRHALVSRTVMLTGVPRHLARSPRELEWFWGPGLQLGRVEKVRVCPFNTRLTSSARARAMYLVNLEHAYMQLLGNPCVHAEYDPERLRVLAMDPQESARAEERELLARWAKPSRRRKTTTRHRVVAETEESSSRCGVEQMEKAEEEEQQPPPQASAVAESVKRPHILVRSSTRVWWPWERVDAIDYWRTKFLEADISFRQLRDTQDRSSDDQGRSTTAFVTFEDAASAHMVTQLSCYPNPGYMKARLAPEPRGVYWPNVWISSRRKWAGFTLKWVCVLVIWAFWSVPVILFSSLLTPASLGKIFPSVLSANHSLLRSFLSTTVPSVFLLLFLNMLPWILKQVHFVTGVRTKPDIDYSVMTKMWAFLVFNVILVFGFSGTFWNQILNVVNNPGTVMQKLASNIPRVGTFFTGYILVLGVGYQPFKLLQLRPVVWHIGRQWLCSTPRDYARLVSPVYIDWYSVYPYPLLVFGIAMIYSTFSPPVVVGAVIYFVIGYPVMKYLLLYVYFHPFETAGMAWPKVCRRMILSVILYQIVILTFVIVRGGGWYTFSMVPIIMLYMWFFYHVGWSLEKQGTVLPVYLWRNPPPHSSYPLPPDGHEDYDAASLVSPYAGPTTGCGDSLVGKPPTLRAMHVGSPQHHMFGVDPYSPPPAAVVAARRTGSLLQGARALVQPTAATSTNRVAKRVVGSSGGHQHRRESSRGARTREIILAGGRHKPGSGGSALGGAAGLGARRPSASSLAATAAVAARMRAASVRSSSAAAPTGASAVAKKRKSGRAINNKRYKSLAEAATAEGSRLIMSLGKLPSELYSRHSSSRRSSMASSTGGGGGGGGRRRWSSLSGRMQAMARPAGKDSAAMVDQPLPLAREARAAAEAVRRRVDSATGGSAEWAARGVRSRSPLAHEVAGDDDEDAAEWSDEWDPLVYLRRPPPPQPPVRTSHGGRSKSATLGTLLADLGRAPQATAPPPPLPPPAATAAERAYASNIAAAVASDHAEAASSSAAAAAAGLRRRRRHHHHRQASAADLTESAADSESAPVVPLTRRARVGGTLRRIRDYFLADFRPAGPILDLTYDRLYSQGIDDAPPPADADGDSVPPLRQLLGHVLPRSVSRTFLGAAASSSSPAEPPSPADPLPVMAAMPVTRMRSATAGRFVRHSRHAGSVASAASPQSPWAVRPPMHSRHHSEVHHRTAPARWSPDGPTLLPPPTTWSAGSSAFAADLPLPLPRAPWMSSSASADPLSHSTRGTPSVTSSQEAIEAIEAIEAMEAMTPGSGRHRRSSHKNSLPPPRLPLPARVVSGLNYATRQTPAHPP